MSPPIYTPDGQEVTEIVLPDGSTASEVVAPDGSVVFDAGPDIPDSVVNQYKAEDFTNPWPDAVGAADMSVNGLTSSTLNGESGVFADGLDDRGNASPLRLGANLTWGLAVTITGPADGGKLIWSSSANFDDIFAVADRSGKFDVFIRADRSGEFGVQSTTTVWDDTNTYAVVVNKTGDSDSDIEIYVDDMTTDEATIRWSGSTDTSQWAGPADSYFYVQENVGSFSDYKEATVGIFEFNTEPYTQQERENFVQRRPEV